MKKISCAIIGLGRIASLLEEDSLREKPCTHAGAIEADEDCELAAGCDIDEERRKLFAQKWGKILPRTTLTSTNSNQRFKDGQVRVYSDAAEMITIHKPDILVIATHPDSHYKYCRLAAEMQVPVVICEKPLADNIKDARKIVKLAYNGGQAGNGKPAAKSSPIIITNHERRYCADYIRAKAILAEEKLGRLLSARACLYMGKTAPLIGQLWHDGTHLADAIMFLTDGLLKHKRRWGAKLSSKSGTAWLEGVIEKKKSHRDTENTKDTKEEKRLIKSVTSVPPCLRERSFPVILEIGAGRDHLVFEIEFSCEKGRLRIGNGVFEVWESVPSPYAEKFRSLKNTGETFSGPTGYFANMLKDAAACVKDPARQPVSGAADGLGVIEYLNSVGRWR